jgi:hypothetical protein
VAATGELAVAGKLIFTNDTSVVVLEADASVSAAATGVFVSKTTGTPSAAGVTLGVHVPGALNTLTNFTSDNVSSAVTVTTGGTDTDTALNGTDYVVGNATFPKLKNNTKALSAPAAITSTAATQAGVGKITAGTATAISLGGSA